MPASNHLEEILNKQAGSQPVQVVFIDIEKYSLRTSRRQRSVIDKFTETLKGALTEISQKYVDYSQKNDKNFSNDILRIPTGDGVAVVFSFNGLDRIHLDFAEILISHVHAENHKADCSKFNEYGWCNCHDNFNIRIGINEGKGIFYRDLNENYNLAGSTINYAARILAFADRMQILLTANAYENLVDSFEDLSTQDLFRRYPNVSIKHENRIDIYQYAPQGNNCINFLPPKDLELHQKMEQVKAFNPLLKEMEKMTEDQQREMVAENVESMLKMIKMAMKPKGS